MTQLNPNYILPVGTYVVAVGDICNSAGDVVAVKGSVGIVVKAPVDHTHSYTVRFSDGVEQALKRGEMHVQKAYRQPLEPEGRWQEIDLYQYVIFRCVTGSRAYGLDDSESDTDTRGIYLPPADLHWSLYGVPEQLENPDREEVYWELQKFVLLALKANPNILECLYTPLVETVTPIAQELLDMRDAFLSRLIFQTYNGYVMSQFRKLQKDIENHGDIRWKHAMHLIRLLISGIVALREGQILVDVDQHRDRLLTIKRGAMSWEAVNIWRKQLHRDFEDAYQTTSLPERPDYEQANDFLIKARRSAL